MKLEIRTIDCSSVDANTCRKDPFSVAVYTLCYQSSQEDRELIDELILKAKELAMRVNPGAANNSTSYRSVQKISANCLAGIVSEYFWRKFLNSEEEIVSETDFDESANQIDLKVISNDKKIEVRSSFPRNGIDFALCNSRYQFDVLGPYSNTYKPGEIEKDYYVRALFHLYNSVDIFEKIKEDGFCVYLTGGATWSMMTDDRFSKDKSLIPDDGLIVESATLYRVVPFSNAIDTQSIKEIIQKGL